MQAKYSVATVAWNRHSVTAFLSYSLFIRYVFKMAMAIAGEFTLS